MLYIDLTTLKCSYDIDIECVLSYALRIVFATLLYLFYTFEVL